MLEDFQNGLEKAKRDLQYWKDISLESAPQLLIEEAEMSAQLFGGSAEEYFNETRRRGIREAESDISYYEKEIAYFKEDFGE